MRLKKKNNTKTETISFRVSKSELNKMKIKAQLYTEGNLSEWIVFSTLNHRPNKGDFEEAPHK
ncbi:MAG: hypothetical protein GY861_17860 [bacterium]|nr:hypothetical protein [bacterium]